MDTWWWWFTPVFTRWCCPYLVHCHVHLYSRVHFFHRLSPCSNITSIHSRVHISLVFSAYFVHVVHLYFNELCTVYSCSSPSYYSVVYIHVHTIFCSYPPSHSCSCKIHTLWVVVKYTHYRLDKKSDSGTSNYCYLQLKDLSLVTFFPDTFISFFSTFFSSRLTTRLLRWDSIWDLTSAFAHNYSAFSHWVHPLLAPCAAL